MKKHSKKSLRKDRPVEKALQDTSARKRPLLPPRPLPPAEAGTCGRSAVAERVHGPAEVRSRPSARTSIVMPMFARATTRDARQRLRAARVAATIIVPGEDWIEPVRAWLNQIFPAHSTLGADGLSKSERADLDISIPENLANGSSLTVVAADAASLPASIVAAADVSLVMHAPNVTDISRAIRVFTGRRASTIVGLPSSVTYATLLSCFRKNAGPDEIVAYLAKSAPVVQPQDERLPMLETAFEYGEARNWALELVADIAAHRADPTSVPWRATGHCAILHSVPGCGKSTFARVLQNSLGGAPLVAFSVADLFANSSGYLDGIIKAWREKMREIALAAQNSPTGFAIAFVDEIDAIPTRVGMSPHAASFWKSFLAEIFIGIDKLVGGTAAGRGEKVILLAATNHVEAVDPALLRPGRFERVIKIDRPSHAGIVNVLRFYLDDDDMLTPAELGQVGHWLAGGTPADVMAAVRSARRIARVAKRRMVLQDLIDAIAPPDTSLAPAALKRIALHEAAHAVASVVVPAGTLRRCVVGSAGNSAGRTFIERETDDLATRDAVERRAIVTLAGRAAEISVLTDFALGCGGDDDSDLASVTSALAMLHASAGAGDTLAYTASVDEALLAVRVDRSLRSIVEAHMTVLQEKAFDVVRRHRPAILAVAEELEVRRHISGDRVRELVEQSTPIEGASRVQTPTSSADHPPEKQTEGASQC